jgi:hypothetical protein
MTRRRLVTGRERSPATSSPLRIEGLGRSADIETRGGQAMSDRAKRRQERLVRMLLGMGWTEEEARAEVRARLELEAQTSPEDIAAVYAAAAAELRRRGAGGGRAMERKIWFRVPTPDGEPIEPTLEEVILDTSVSSSRFPGTTMTTLSGPLRRSEVHG